MAGAGVLGPVTLAAAAGPAPGIRERSRLWRSRWQCRAVAKEDEGEDDAMTDVGLDDVFSLIAQAQEAFPDGRPPEELVAADVTATSTKLRRASTPASRWYSVYGRSVPPSQDARSVFYGPRRPKWPGPIPAYLRGEFPGDYGMDPLGLARDPATFKQLRAKEVMNGRWAMLGVVGCLLPEILQPGDGGVWFIAAREHFVSHPGVLEAGLILFLVVSELARAVGIEDLDGIHPGGKAFDPLGFGIEDEANAELKTKEIENGRLAMFAMAGLFAQALVTEVGPIQNLIGFLQRS